MEMAKGRLSQSFSTELLPGMYSSPIHAVPKAESADFRLVTNQSGGKFSLNSRIEYDDIAGMPLNSMKHLREWLLLIHSRNLSGDSSLYSALFSGHDFLFRNSGELRSSSHAPGVLQASRS